MRNMFIKLQNSRKIKEYLQKVYNISNISAENKSAYLKIKTSNEKEILNIIKSDKLLTHFCELIYYSDTSPQNIHELYDYLQKLDKNKTYRVQAFPKELQYEIVDMLSNAYKLHPKDFQYLLTLFKEKGKYHIAVRPKKYFFRKADYEYMPVSRAYFKIYEAFKLYPDLENHTDNVLDIGSSPGGWVEYLVSKSRIIVAVDPAELLINDKKIIHIQKKIEDSYFDLEKIVVLHGKFDLITCDMNQDPREVARILLDLTKFLKFHGYILFTIKLIYKSKNLIKKLIKETKEIIETNYTIKEIKEFVSNRNEKMLFAEYSKR